MVHGRRGYYHFFSGHIST